MTGWEIEELVCLSAHEHDVWKLQRKSLSVCRWGRDLKIEKEYWAPKTIFNTYD